MLGIVNAETNYYAELRKTTINVPQALEMNGKYCDKLFELYHTLTDAEEREELTYEINYLIEQSRILRIKLHSSEEENENN